MALWQQEQRGQEEGWAVNRKALPTSSYIPPPKASSPSKTAAPHQLGPTEAWHQGMKAFRPAEGTKGISAAVCHVGQDPKMTRGLGPLEGDLRVLESGAHR